MRLRIWIAVAAVLPLVGLASTGTALGSNAIAENEGMVCTSCHDKPGSKLLTDLGKYYEFMGSTEGFDKVTSMFGECTACHSRKPGSKKLTATGRRFERLAGDMAGVRDLASEDHPSVPTPATEEPPSDAPEE